MDYIGKTQRYGKTRTQEHIRDVCKLVDYNRKRKEQGGGDEEISGEAATTATVKKREKYLALDSFARHFAEHCKDCRNKNEVRRMMKEILEYKVIWKGDRINCMKTHKKLNCALYMKERLEILCRWRKDKTKLINDRHKMFGPCQCKTRFHQFVRTTANTDDGSILERVYEDDLDEWTCCECNSSADEDEESTDSTDESPDMDTSLSIFHV